jgi:hypothetical protein
MNVVSLVGTLAAKPVAWDDARGGVECWMRMAVPRHSLGGTREPGVVYVAVGTLVFGPASVATGSPSEQRSGLPAGSTRTRSMRLRIAWRAPRWS